ncbi:hypothetical protein EKN06_13730 [Croceicoccus ponticola]|uniref:Uncharacterized protein n=1 Tax=Croceicoccus ponticola TaxID=2217664 RepID=A0A437GUP6_9SPHN|nr:hypothetical protein [Croceicoccus ponticola]RVQ65294.1 hypothetical protein EKN06_13730 [Croceicoccus ponticola]
MFASNIFGNEDELFAFLGDVEALLRRGQPDVAASILESQLGDLAEEGDELAKLCLKVPVSAIRLVGWEQLAEKLKKFDRPDKRITALSVDISAPFEMPLLEQKHGNFYEPDLDTVFYSDSAFPFSGAHREDLLDCYTPKGGPWSGGFEHVDATIAVRGMGGIYGEVLLAQRRCRPDDHNDPMEQDSAVLASAFVAVRLHQAIKSTAEGRGMPRPMMLMVGNNESFPYFDAAVLTRPEYEDLLDVEGEEDDCGAADEMFAPLQIAPIPDDYDPFASMPGEDQVSGAALRKKLREIAPEPEIANDVAPTGFGGFINKLLKRSA